MWEGWKNKIVETPKDDLQYKISSTVIKITGTILKEYGSQKPPAEGLVYWAGQRHENDLLVTHVIAPKIKSDRYGLTVSHLSNFAFVKSLSETRIIHIAQVHSHPTSWVGHSPTDDEDASFKFNGLLSVVIPHFSKRIIDFATCGFHRHNGIDFIQLSQQYVTEHIKIEDFEGKLIDLRK